MAILKTNSSLEGSVHDAVRVKSGDLAVETTQRLVYKWDDVEILHIPVTNVHRGNGHTEVLQLLRDLQSHPKHL